MNERIQELIIEANNYAIEKCPIPDDADSMTKELIVGNRLGESQRKLAELLVKECAMIVEGFTFEWEVADDQYQDYEASDVLKKHFGVE
jgi:hypothetical protein